MNWLLIKLVVLVGVLFALFVEWEIRENARLIDKDGSQNSLRQLFHRQRTVIRGIVIAVLAAVPTLAYRGQPWPMGLTWLATGIYLAGYFVRTFNPRLNVARKQPYISRFYVSFFEDAAKWPDQWIAKRARARAVDTIAYCQQFGWEPDTDVDELARQYATDMLKSTLNRILFGCIGLSLALGVVAALLASPIAGH